jgi:REP-associated tyrosine transposase
MNAESNDGRARRPVAPTNLRGYVDPVGRRNLPHEAPLWAKTEEQIFFITICCRPRGENHLCKSETARLLFESIAFRHQRGDWFVHVALLMPDHLHLLVSFPPEGDMQKVLRLWKSFSARMLGISWQRDFFDHRLRREESFLEKEDYIRANPVRAGLIRDQEDWPYVWSPQLVGATELSRPTE